MLMETKDAYLMRKLREARQNLRRLQAERNQVAEQLQLTEADNLRLIEECDQLRARLTSAGAALRANRESQGTQNLLQRIAERDVYGMGESARVYSPAPIAEAPKAESHTCGVCSTTIVDNRCDPDCPEDWAAKAEPPCCPAGCNCGGCDECPTYNPGAAEAPAKPRRCIYGPGGPGYYDSPCSPGCECNSPRGDGI